MVFVDWYLPGYKAGGPIRSVHNMIRALKNSYDFLVVTSDKDYGSPGPYNDIQTNQWVEMDGAKVMYLNRQGRTFRNLKKLIRQEQFDRVYLNSLFSIYYTLIPILILKIWKKNVHIILAPRGMLGDGALRIKSAKKKIFLTLARFAGFYKGITWHATTASEAKEIQHHFGRRSVVRIVPNIVALSGNSQQQASILKSTKNLRLIFLSRVSEKKNLLHAINYLGGLSQDKYQQIIFDIYGPIEDLDYWRKCEIVIKKLPEKCHINYCGEKKYDETLQLWNHYHFFLMPTAHENYGHAIVEALSHGCPVIISDQTPWHELEKYKAGWDLPLDEAARFTEILEKCIDMNQNEWSEMVKSARRFIRKKIHTGEVIELNRQLFE